MIADAKSHSLEGMIDSGMLDIREYGECQRKVPYMSKADAMRKSSAQGDTKRPYKCHHCGMWHVTTGGKRIRKPTDRKEEGS